MRSTRISLSTAVILALMFLVSTSEARFLSVDPKTGDVGSSQSWNRYSYVLNNPVNLTDPDGQLPVIPILVAFIFAVGGGAEYANTPTSPNDPVLTDPEYVNSGGARALSSCAAGAAVGVALDTLFSSHEPAASPVETAENASDAQKLLPANAGPTGQISPTEVAGRTPSEINQRAGELGLQGRGPDPAGGRGAYIDPQTGQQRVLVHPSADPPHGHVNNPAGQRIGPDGRVVPPESPEAHLRLRGE